MKYRSANNVNSEVPGNNVADKNAEPNNPASAVHSVIPGYPFPFARKQARGWEEGVLCGSTGMDVTRCERGRLYEMAAKIFFKSSPYFFAPLTRA